MAASDFVTAHRALEIAFDSLSGDDLTSNEAREAVALLLHAIAEVQGKLPGPNNVIAFARSRRAP